MNTKLLAKSIPLGYGWFIMGAAIGKYGVPLLVIMEIIGNLIGTMASGKKREEKKFC